MDVRFERDEAAQSPAPSSPAASGDRRRDRNRRGEGEQLRAEILAAVARLLDLGVRAPRLALSLRQVASETGIAPQSIYLHFRDKESLAWATADDGYQRLLAAMFEAAGVAADDPEQAVRLQAHAFLAFAQRNLGVFRLMFGQDVADLDPSHPEHPGRRIWVQWLESVRACARAPRSWPDGAEPMAQLLWAGLLGRFTLWSTTFGQDVSTPHADFVDRLVDVLLSQRADERNQVE